MIDPELQKLLEASKSSKKNTKKLIKQLSTKKPKEVDHLFHNHHDEAFEEIDCLACANCCKTTSPIFTDRDIDRIASSLSLKPSLFIEKFLYLDEDDHYVLQSSPCHFLGEDNKCSIYDVRPIACREYPHTNRKKMTQILDLTYRNSLVCPAVVSILSKIRKGLHN